MDINNIGKSVIGIFDSGVGGLSVWKELINFLPGNPMIYFSDSAYCPYGQRPQQDIILRAKSITNFLISQGASIIVVACNTATSAAINSLRGSYNIPFIGMEPAVKPAALKSKSGTIGVLATQGTLNGKLYHTTLERFASDINVIERVGSGLVEQVESGNIHDNTTIELLKKYINPMLEQGADHIVLGCTHYPFLMEEIRSIAGNEIVIVDPAPAVAQHTYATMEKYNLVSTGIIDKSLQTRFYSSGSVENLSRMARSIISSIPEDYFKKITI